MYTVCRSEFLPAPLLREFPSSRNKLTRKQQQAYCRLPRRRVDCRWLNTVVGAAVATRVVNERNSSLHHLPGRRVTSDDRSVYEPPTAQHTHTHYRLKPGFHSNAIACVGKEPIMVATASTEHSYWLALAFLAVFVYATHVTQAIAFEWKPGFTQC